MIHAGDHMAKKIKVRVKGVGWINRNDANPPLFTREVNFAREMRKNADTEHTQND